MCVYIIPFIYRMSDDFIWLIQDLIPEAIPSQRTWVRLDILGLQGVKDSSRGFSGCDAV